MRFVLLVFLCVFAPLRENSSFVNAQTTDRIQREAQEFRLEDVRLLDGPFKNAMARDAAYLLRLDPEALTRGKNKITIRFEAQPANIAGGFYGVRLIRNE